MTIVSKKKIETCFDGSQMYQYSLSGQWTEKTIRALSGLGKLEYFADFPRPFFRVRRKSGFQLKGVFGEATCVAIFPPQEFQYIQNLLENHFSLINV